MSPAGVGVGRRRTRRANSLYQATTPAFHNLVCRRQPAWAIAMKACPILRSGIDRSGSLSPVIRGIPSSFRPPKSSFRRRPESRGVGAARGLVPNLGRTARWPTLHRPASHHSHPLMRPSQGHGDSGERGNPGRRGAGIPSTERNGAHESAGPRIPVRSGPRSSRR